MLTSREIREETIRTSRRSYSPAIELGTTAKMQKKNMNSPDETRSFDKGKAEITTLANVLCKYIQ
jgi:hypothetical protein